MPFIRSDLMTSDRGITRRFQSINTAYQSVFRSERLSLGLVVPIESYPSNPLPSLLHQLERIQLAESLGFSSVWLRDVPFIVPSFGDGGQLYDPFVYLGLLSGHTSKIALGIASIILPLRHPAHTFKAAASVDQLSNGRLLLGVASGDRPSEYPAMNVSFEQRSELFRQHFTYIREMSLSYPSFENHFGRLSGQADILPKPSADKIPLLVTGSSRQDPQWIAEHADGCMIYPRPAEIQRGLIEDWRSRTSEAGRQEQPIMQALYVDYMSDPNFRPEPIHLGMRTGKEALLHYLKALEQVGMNHVAINLRFNSGKIEETLQRLAEEILPEFQYE